MGTRKGRTGEQCGGVADVRHARRRRDRQSQTRPARIYERSPDAEGKALLRPAEIVDGVGIPTNPEKTRNVASRPMHPLGRGGVTHSKRRN